MLPYNIYYTYICFCTIPPQKPLVSLLLVQKIMMLLQSHAQTCTIFNGIESTLCRMCWQIRFKFQFIKVNMLKGNYYKLCVLLHLMGTIWLFSAVSLIN